MTGDEGSELDVRPMRQTDRGAVDDVLAAAFGAQGAVVVDLVADLRDRAVDDGLALVAERDGRVIGAVLLSGCLIDASRRLVPALVLSPLGVLPAEQGRGAGARLVRGALVAADAHGAPFVLLEGDPRYYGRFGFVAARSLGLRRPSLRIPDAGFRAHPLQAAEPWMTGTMVYPDVWWRHDLVGLRSPRGEEGR